MCGSENGGHDGRVGKAKAMGRTRLPIPRPAPSDSRSLKARSIPGPLADKFGYASMESRLAYDKPNQNRVQRGVSRRMCRGAYNRGLRSLEEAHGRSWKDGGCCRTLSQPGIGMRGTNFSCSISRCRGTFAIWNPKTKVQLNACEVTMEELPGIAHLCIMVAVLVFAAPTPGSREESVYYIPSPGC